MKYRRLGKTELQASVVALGTWQFGGEWGKDFMQPEVNAIVEVAISAAIVPSTLRSLVAIGFVRFESPFS